MEEFVTVIGLGKPYDFVPDGSTEHLTGCTMWYLPTGDLTTSHEDFDNGFLGYAPLKQTMGVDFYETVKKVGLPCKARVEYGMKSSGGKMALYIKGLNFVPAKAAAK